MSNEYAYAELLDAFERDDISDIEYFLCEVAEITDEEDRCGNTIMYYASRMQNHDLCLRLINNHSADATSALFHATDFGDMILAKRILEETNASPNFKQYGLTTLMNSVHGFPDKTLFHQLLDAGACVDGVFYHAASYGDLTILNFLLEFCPENIDERDYFGHTPLMRAIISQQWDSVKLLISNGANLAVKNNDGETPMKMVYDSGNESMIEMFWRK
jgi:ankyrin repeat protein